MRILFYTSHGFPACDDVRDYLRTRGFQFDEIDVSRDPEAWRAMLRKSNQMGVPVIDIDGEIVVGFDRLKLHNIFNKQK